MSLIIRALFGIICFFNCCTALAQDTQLQQYLETHQTVLRRNNDSTLALDAGTSTLLDKIMQGKQLLVLGEGCSHFLRLNADLWELSVAYLSTHGLKYVFEEGARAWAMQNNYFFQHPELSAKSYYPSSSPYYQQLDERSRALYQQSRAWSMVGIDFERAQGFYNAMQDIMKGLDNSTAQKVYAIAPYAADTTVLHKDAKEFMQYYRKARVSFLQDSASLKELLGPRYATFRYIVTNPNINTPYGKRDKPMANNLLAEIQPLVPGATYLLDCGMAHSRPNIRGTLVNRISKSDLLRGRVAVMNLVCDDCSTPAEPTSNWAFPFMKGSTLETFKKAAKGDIVIFDMSTLPAPYNYIKAYGDLLVLAQHQH